jgi:flagellar protein FlbD
VIQLTCLNRRSITVNPDWIGSIEATPDTTLHLITGESLVVREDVAQVVQLVIEFRARVLTAADLSAALTSGTTRVAALLDSLRHLETAREPDVEPAHLPHP